MWLNALCNVEIWTLMTLRKLDCKYLENLKCGYEDAFYRWTAKLINEQVLNKI